MKRILFVFFLLGVCGIARADDTNPNDKIISSADVINVMYNGQSTDCASKIFSDALIQHSDEVSEMDSENVVRAWAKNTMLDADVLVQVLKCPEIQSQDEMKTIAFTPIVYNFPNGRNITINYSTQPKVLKQHLILASKRSLPNGDASPKLMNPDDPAKYINTDPAWYGIMVVQHNSLAEFVGPDKNNTLSLKYINDHIDDIYPHGYYCTSKTAWANDKDTINNVVREVVDIEDDTNDYYVAGDASLEWVMYAEIAADVIITVATMGGGELALAALKGARASRIGIQLAKNVSKLKALPHVADYAKAANKITSVTMRAERLEKNLANAKKYEKALKKLEKAKKSNDATDIAKYQKQLEDITQAAKKIDPGITDDLLKSPDKITEEVKKINDAIPDMKKDLKELKKGKTKEQIKDIDNYVENTQQLEEILKYRNNLRAFKRPQTGNVVTKKFKKMGAYIKTARAINTGADTMDKATKVARAGMSSRSAKIGDWLFDKTLKHGATLARFERDAGMVYGALTFLGEMYDQTSSTSKEFSNGIEFKPLCLLSADDLKGQENVVNYGMWLMWVGNSTDAADDDAAYLQAMDFAAKFFYKLDEYQDKNGANCNVDIYVVRPIIRLDETNLENPSGEMFYLFMNEIPWSTAAQFNEMIDNVEDWERNQSELSLEDPNNKNHKLDNDVQEQIAAPETVLLDENTNVNVVE